MGKELSLTIFNYTNIHEPNGLPSNLKNSAGNYGLGIINIALGLLFLAATLLALIMIIIAGIAWITSGGDKEAIQKARGRLTYSIIGLVVVFISFFLVNTIGSFFGIQILSLIPK